jgi:hypothetical protein
MMKGKGILLLACLALLILADTAAAQMSTPKKWGLRPLNRNQFEITGHATGMATTRMWALWPLPLWWVKGDNGSFTFWGLDVRDQTNNRAYNRAVRSYEGANKIIEPVYDTKKYSAFWYYRVDVRVQGPVFRIKYDDQCKEDPACYDNNCWDELTSDEATEAEEDFPTHTKSPQDIIDIVK